MLSMLMTPDDDARLHRKDLLVDVKSVAPSVQKAWQDGSLLFHIMRCTHKLHASIV